MKLREVAKWYYPPISFGLDTFIACNKVIGRKIESNSKGYKLMQEAIKEYRRRARSNNWRKMHGYPMRRRRH